MRSIEDNMKTTEMITVIAEAAKAGVTLHAFEDLCDAHFGTWSVLDVGAPALLHWYSDHGFYYRARFGRRWKTWAKGKRLPTVLKKIKHEMDRERDRKAGESRR